MCGCTTCVALVFAFAKEINEVAISHINKTNNFCCRELPNPLLTYHLYDKFVVSIHTLITT